MNGWRHDLRSKWAEGQWFRRNKWMNGYRNASTKDGSMPGVMPTSNACLSRQTQKTNGWRKDWMKEWRNEGMNEWMPECLPLLLVGAGSWDLCSRRWITKQAVVTGSHVPKWLQVLLELHSLTHYRSLLQQDKGMGQGKKIDRQTALQSWCLFCNLNKMFLSPFCWLSFFLKRQPEASDMLKLLQRNRHSMEGALQACQCMMQDGMSDMQKCVTLIQSNEVNRKKTLFAFNMNKNSKRQVWFTSFESRSALL